MVQRQRDKWPWDDPKRKFNPSKTRIEELRAVLLNPSFGFTLPNEPAASGGASRTGTGMGEGSVGLGDDNQAGGSGLVCLFLFFLQVVPLLVLVIAYDNTIR
jgi:hypothetical protein